MATRARKVPELPGANSVAATDLYIIETVSGNTTITSKISGTNVKKSMVKGPYANDSAANTGGVLVGEMYYTADGSVKVRLT